MAKYAECNTVEIAISPDTPLLEGFIAYHPDTPSEGLLPGSCLVIKSVDQNSGAIFFGVEKTVVHSETVLGTLYNSAYIVENRNLGHSLSTRYFAGDHIFARPFRQRDVFLAVAGSDIAPGMPVGVLGDNVVQRLEKDFEDSIGVCYDSSPSVAGEHVSVLIFSA